MALEDALLKLAEAINNHAEALKANAGYVAPAQAKAQPKKQTEPTSADAAQTPEKLGQKTDTDTTAPTATTETPEVETEAETVDVAAMTADFLKLVNTDRAKAEAVLTKLGFPRLKLVPANKHAEAYALIKGALNG